MRFVLAFRAPRLVAPACLALLSLAPAPAFAQSAADRATARTLGGEGQQALDAKDYKTAEDRFRRADSLVHAPTLMLGLARALAAEGKFVEAQEEYNRIVREGIAPNAPEVFKRALADAKKEVDSVSPKIGSVVITVRSSSGGEVPSVKVMLDGSPVNAASLGVQRSVDPGSHVVQASADGFKAGEVRFEVTEAGSATATVTLEPEAGPPPGATPAGGAPPSGTTGPGGAEQAAGATAHAGGARAILPWVAFGVGGVGLAAGAVTGFLAMGKHSDLANSNHCQNGTCDSTQSSNLDSYHAMATIATIGFVVGGVGVAAGVVLLVTQPKAEATAPAEPPRTGLRVVPVVGPGSIGAVGEF